MCLSFFFMAIFPLYLYATFCLSIHVLMYLWIVPPLWNVTNVAVNIGIQIFESHLFFFFFFFLVFWSFGFFRATPAAYVGLIGALTHWARPRIKPPTLWFLVGFVSAAPQQELLMSIYLRMEYAKPYGNSCFTFWETAKLFSAASAPFYIPTNRVPISLNLWGHLLFFIFLILIVHCLCF